MNNFIKDGTERVVIDTNEGKAIFNSAENLSLVTKLDKHEFKQLIGSFIHATFYKTGETMKYGQVARTDRLVKKIHIRLNENNSNVDTYPSVMSEYEPSYEVHRGAFGFDDDTIDSAFEGDPSNCWNVD